MKKVVLLLLLVILIAPELFAQDFPIPYGKNRKFGFVDKDKKVLIPFQYDDVSEFRGDGYAVVKKEGKLGLINTKGEEVLPLIYSNIEYKPSHAKEDWVYVAKDKKWGAVDHQNQVKIDFKYDKKPRACRNKLYELVENGKCGIISSEGKLIIPVVYDLCVQTTDGYFKVKKDGRWGLYTEKGDLIIKVELTDFPHTAYVVEHNYIKAKKSYRWGLYNLKGALVLEHDYIDLRLLSPYFAKSKRGTKANEDIINIKGKILAGNIHGMTAHVLGPEGKYIAVKNKHKYALFNSKGNALSDYVYTEVVDNKCDKPTFLVKDDQGYTFVNQKMKAICSDYFDFAEPLSSQTDTTIVKQNGKYALYTLKAGYLGETKYDKISRFTQQYYKVQKGHKVGLLDRNLKVFVPLKYTDLALRTDDYYTFYKGHHQGLLNLKGEECIPPDYKDISHIYYVGDFFIVRKGKKHALMHEEGELLTEFVYDDMSVYHDGNFAVRVKKGHHYGVINSQGHEICPVKYDEVKIVRDCAILKKANMFEIVDLHQVKPITKQQYDEVEVVDDYFIVRKGHKWGIVKKDGAIMMPVVSEEKPGYYTYSSEVGYMHQHLYYSGMTPVVIDGKLGFYNIEGKYVVKAEYDLPRGEGYDFYRPKYRNGFVWLSQDFKKVYVDKSANEFYRK